jgi:hypothetical protein
VWHESKINYVFIFEYDTRHHLDWRQLSELPCWCLFFLGLFMYLNFHQIAGEPMFVYYPVILIGISVGLLFNPIKMCYFQTRMWLLYSLVSQIQTTTSSYTNPESVAPVTRRHISRRMARLLHG